MDKFEKPTQGFSLFLGNPPFFDQANKQVIDALFAGTAWLIADRLWDNPDWNIRRLAIWVLLAVAVNSVFQLSSQLYRLAGIRDAIRIALATATLAGTSLLFKILVGPPFHVSILVPNVAFIASILTGMFWGAFRVSCRVWGESRDHPLYSAKRNQLSHRTVIWGAGRAGSLVAQEMLRRPDLGYHLIGFIDDASQKQRMRIHGVKVIGDSKRLSALVAKHAITHAILAIPSASGKAMRDINAAFLKMNVQVKTVPGWSNLLGNKAWQPVIRDVSIEDVLRRDPVKLDHSALIEAVEGSTVLITGAGGSIGSELARQVAAFKPGRIVMLGRGENSLWQIQREFQSLFPEQPFSLELMDIRNRVGLREVFDRYRPEIVLHAAAHKHVPFLETHPIEAVQNNVFGSLNVAEGALDYGARALVNISTDKAVNPTNVLGASKRIAECIVLNASALAGPQRRFVSVRFGNVLGSRGSVVPIFRDQIKAGGPITVTHAEMTRYFMTIPEASQLVLQAGLLGDTGKVYVLDMGDPVKIKDLAEDMIRLSGMTPGRDIDIQITGLRPGEKLHEELFLDHERFVTAVHPKVFEVNPEGIPPAVLEKGLDKFLKAFRLPHEARQPQIVDLLKHLVPTYTPSVLGVGMFGGHVKDRRINGSTPPIGQGCRRRNSQSPILSR